MNCEHCQKEIESKQAKRFCGTTCWYEFQKASKIVPCAHCGTSFKKTYAKQKACSVECGNQLKMVDKGCVCKQCGTLFKRPHGKQRMFCSNSCAMFNRENSPTGKAHPQGASFTNSNGYIQVKTGSKWAMQHRVVVEENIGRALTEQERVHHKDGNRSNNSLDNLELWAMKGMSKKDPSGQRWSDLISSMPINPVMTDVEIRAMLLKFLINK